MEHFHFHLSECGDYTHDEDGADFPNLDAARRAAVTAAREIMCEELKSGQLCLSCHIDIADGDAKVLSRVGFWDVVTVTGLRGHPAD